ncbi:riboflavin synthase subunit alpha [Enterobacteriaceae endosymbiont of Plateumaris rustica]|uniref:riboflavin synthase subunit alpha n=1 Tax=Enterobacteriaceae endosymbiont of Plateumaris rustica TaxID=2675796 RepID=UPI0014491239|nr:riboflavin synthase subunit alpha [Enterobacteriaceae endosymbiont of Plateumaris rustica]QJC28972.1 riboflavin synthase subunit alpha [Enterobacteriaceae endosymbiont of Plateumaris rustica]
MFTGIIQCIAIIKLIIKEKNFIHMIIKIPNYFISDLKKGDSISNNGCCLTIKKINKNLLFFDIIKNTLDITTFKKLEKGNYLNIEKSLRLIDFIGGHLVSGHITGIAKIIKIKNYINSKTIWFKPFQKSQMKYIMKKGFICIDGISLTIDKVYIDQFSINLIPETMILTSLVIKKINQNVNIEVDLYTKIAVNTIEKLFYQ